MIYVMIIIVVFAIDRITKMSAEKKLSAGKDKKILGGFIELKLFKNKGIMLGYLRKWTVLVRVINVIGVIVASIIFVIILKGKQNTVTRLGLSALLGGAFGNVYDRLRHGEVTDFFAFKFKRNIIFNLADMFIFLGGILTCIGIEK